MIQINTITVGTLQANCYIIVENGSCAVIDPGAEGRRIIAALKEMGAVPGAVLLTHGHFDHFGAMWPLFECYGMPVYLSQADTQPIVNPAPRRLVPPPGARFLSDGQEISVGTLHFRVLATPGHTPGSVCFQLENALFTGDTLFHMECGRCDFNCSSPEDMLRSLARLRALEGNLQLLPGHLGPTTLDFEREHNPFLKPGIQFYEPEEEEEYCLGKI